MGSADHGKPATGHSVDPHLERSYSIDLTRLRAYVESGDLESLSDDEVATLQDLTRRAKNAALTSDDVKRIWPRKVAVVILDGSKGAAPS